MQQDIGVAVKTGRVESTYSFLNTSSWKEPAQALVDTLLKKFIIYCYSVNTGLVGTRQTPVRVRRFTDRSFVDIREKGRQVLLEVSSKVLPRQSEST